MKPLEEENPFGIKEKEKDPFSLLKGGECIRFWFGGQFVYGVVERVNKGGWLELSEVANFKNGWKFVKEKTYVAISAISYLQLTERKEVERTLNLKESLERLLGSYVEVVMPQKSYFGKLNRDIDILYLKPFLKDKGIWETKKPLIIFLHRIEAIIPRTKEEIEKLYKPVASQAFEDL
jgi:hypothetical protein